MSSSPQRELIALLPRLRRFARALTRHPANADDLVQITLERALARPGQFQAGRALDKWVFGILRNAWLDDLRTQRRWARVVDGDADGEQAPDAAGGTPLEAIALRDAIARLPPEQRLAVALVLIEGYSYREAAEIAGVPEGTLTSRVARGRAALLAELDGGRPTMVRDDELAALADGELHDPERRRAVEAAVAADPALAARLAQHRALRERAAAAFGGVLDEPVPERLIAAAQAPVRTRPGLGSLAPLAAMAASLVVGVVIGRLAATPEGPVVATSDGLQARGELARALDGQLSDARGGRVEVAFSFRAQDGGVCRAFVMTQEALGGLACRHGDRWAVAATAESTGGPRTEYRAAATALPAAVLAAADGRRAGDAFGLDEERRARDAKWQAAPTADPPRR